MSYHLYGFGGEPPGFANGVLLPTGQSVDGLGAEVPSDVAATAGGSHFAYGSGIVPLGVHRINHRGIYFTDVKTSVNNFFGLLGQRKKLWRKQDGEATYQWKHARLLRCQWDRDVSQSQHAEVISEFEAVGYWKSATAENVVLNDGTLQPVGGGDAPVYDAVLTFKAGSVPMTSASMADTESGIKWEWEGSGDNAVAAEKSLTIDCGAFSVQNNGVNAYSSFVLNNDHASDYWCAILPGDVNNFTATAGGSVEQIKIEWYDSWV